MKVLSIFLFVLGLILQTGCTSQARKTHLVFEKQYVNYNELHAALEALKPVGHEGATHHQYKAAKALRHIARHMEDPAKREMAARALVFLSVFNDDRNVEKSSLSRMDAILEDENEEMAIKVAVIDELENIITAKSGYTAENKNYLTGKETSDFIFPEVDAREDALEYLMDQFESLPEYLQTISIKAFSRILDNPVTCYQVYNGRCSDDDADDQEEWKEELKEQVGEWLEDRILSPMIKFSLVRLIETSAASAEDKERNKSISLMQEWIEEDDIPKQTRDVIQIALNKLEGRYPDLVDQGSETEDPQNASYRRDEEYRNLEMVDNVYFWYANSEMILEKQLFSENAGEGDSEFMQVPSEWPLFDGYSSERSSKVLREIIYHTSTDALSRGFLLSSEDSQVDALAQNLVSAARESVWALDRTLTVAARMYPSLLKNQADVQYLVDLIMERIGSTSRVHEKRLYYMFLVEGMPYFQPLIEHAVCSSLKGADLLTRHLVKVKVASLPAPLEPLTFSKYVGMGAAAVSGKNTSDEDDLPYIQNFCDENITSLKPKNPVLSIVRKPGINGGDNSSFDQSPQN